MSVPAGGYRPPLQQGWGESNVRNFRYRESLRRLSHGASRPLCSAASGTGEHRYFLIRWRPGFHAQVDGLCCRCLLRRRPQPPERSQRDRPHAILHRGGSSEGNAQPIVVKSIRNYGTVALVHNGNLINAVSLRQWLERQGAIFQSTSDSEVILHLLARSEADNLLDALAETLAQVQGAFSLLLLTQDSLIAVRDPNGFRPLNIGKINSSYALASETCAFDLIGATYIREVEPGEMVLIRGDQFQSVKALHAPRLAKCIFEHVYFSRPDSVVFGRSVQASRDLMGRILAQESPVDVDLVVPIPDSGVAAAIGYSQEAQIPFAFGLIRNHYVGRTFIEPKTKIRHFGVKVKLNPVKEVLAGKRVVLIDDSIVRGTTSRKIVKLVRAAGAREVHMRISCPPTLSPCFYGIDTPTKKN